MRKEGGGVHSFPTRNERARFEEKDRLRIAKNPEKENGY